MQEKTKWLQMFAEDGQAAESLPSAGSANATAGVIPEAAASETRAERLEKLGVPKDRLERRAYKEAVKAGRQAAAVAPEEAKSVERLSFEELLKDPEYKDEFGRKVQDIVTKRVAKLSKAREDFSPALEILAKKHGFDTENPDLKALSDAIVNDPSFYEEKAERLGVSVEAAKEISRAERINAEYERKEAFEAQRQKIREHLNGLQSSAAELRERYPDFDLMRELENPTFVRLTAPDSGLSLEDAYFALHRQDILSSVAANTRQQLSNAIQAGRLRPDEGGVPKSNNASVTAFNWHNASKQQREDMKKRIYAAAAENRYIRPGSYT